VFTLEQHENLLASADGTQLYVAPKEVGSVTGNNWQQRWKELIWLRWVNAIFC